MRRVWLRGREHIEKRHLIHVAGFNLGLLMRIKTDYGTLRGGNAWFAISWPDSEASCAYLAVVLVFEDEVRLVIPIVMVFAGH